MAEVVQQQGGAEVGGQAQQRRLQVIRRSSVAETGGTEPGPTEIHLRIGVSTGDIGWSGDGCFGRPVVEAAWLEAAAGRDEILATRRTVEVAAGRTELTVEPAGDLELKGLPGTTPTVRVRWADASLAITGIPLPPSLASEPPLGLVGRDGDRRWLRRCWDDAVGGAKVTAVMTGEPGIGKHTLAADLARSVHGSGAVVLHADGQASGDRLDLIRRLLAPFLGTDRRATLADDKLTADVDEIGALVELSPVASTRPEAEDPKVASARLAGAASRLLAGLAGHDPLLVLLTNADAFDPGSLDLVRDELHLPGRCLLVVTGAASLRWTGASVTRQLTGLGTDDIGTLLDMAGRDGSPPALDAWARPFEVRAKLGLARLLADRGVARRERVDLARDAGRLASTMGMECLVALARSYERDGGGAEEH